MYSSLESLAALTLVLILYSSFLQNAQQSLHQLVQHDGGSISRLDYMAPELKELERCFRQVCQEGTSAPSDRFFHLIDFNGERSTFAGGKTPGGRTTSLNFKARKNMKKFTGWPTSCLCSYKEASTEHHWSIFYASHTP